MKQYRVTTPSPKFTGESAEVHFRDGVATLVVRGDDPDEKAARQLAYFREAGYGVQEIDADGEPVEVDEKNTEPLPADTASDFRWRLYAVQHAGMSVSNVDALGDRADVMRAVRERQERRTGVASTSTTPAKKRAPRKASTVPGDDATNDELRQFVKTKAIEAGDDDLAQKVNSMSRDELVAHVKGQAK